MNNLIFRQDAIDEIESLLDKTAKGDIGTFYNKILKLAIEHIQKMPSARQWIPCSEALPEEEKNEYWICTDTEYQCSCRWTNDNPFWHGKTTDWHL